MAGNTQSFRVDRIVLGRMHFRLRPVGYTYNTAYHRYSWEIDIVRQGCFTVDYPGQLVTARQGEAIIIAPRVVHSHHNHGPDDALVLSIHFRAPWPQIRDKCGVPLTVSSQAQIIVGDILRQTARDAIGFMKLRCQLALLIGELISPQQEAEPEAYISFGRQWMDPLVQRVLTIMRDEMQNPLPLKRLCRETGYSASRLCAMFRKVTRMSLTESMLRLRLEEAQRLLLHSPMKIGVIATMVGFKHAPKFNQFFRRRTGLTPSAFARTHEFVGVRQWQGVERDEVRMEET